MALKDLLHDSSSGKKIGISEERIEHIKPALREYIAFWREYPDLFVDFMIQGGFHEGEQKANPAFQLYSYQRVFLRIAARYKYVYAVYPREFKRA